MRRPPLGEQELEVLKFIADHAPVTARVVAEHFGQEHALARSTVLTVIERLRTKGYLTRRRLGAVYRYSTSVSKADVLHGLVRRFIEDTLGGSVSPVVAYLTRAGDISEEELEELHQLVRELRAARAPGKEPEV